MTPPQLHGSDSQGFLVPPPHVLHMDELPEAPLPPPPILLQNLRAPDDSNEALNAMLMSWYTNGYHTGYYQGMKRAKQAQ